jgi:hypothetical protein
VHINKYKYLYKYKCAELHQTKKLLHSKGNIQQNVMIDYRLGKMFAQHISNKSLILIIHKESVQLNSQKQNKRKIQNKKPILKISKDLNI